MTVCCPFCGAEQVAGGARCRDCGLGAEAVVPSLAPGREEEEVVYGVADWPSSARVQLGTSLNDKGIEWRWEPGFALVVREGDDEAVEELLDEIEEDLGEAGDEVGLEGFEDFDEPGAEGDGNGEPVNQEAEEEAHAAMGDLFVAADRLMHEPWDENVADDLEDAAGVVEKSVPPYGIPPDTWLQIQELASVVRNDLEAANDEVVAQDARALREVLRRYV